MVWIFLIVFPLLFGAPIVVRIEGQDAVQCEKVRKLMIRQLDDHRSNAKVSPACTLGIPTALPPK